jgi:hypothetical protein
VALSCAFGPSDRRRSEFAAKLSYEREMIVSVGSFRCHVPIEF